MHRSGVNDAEWDKRTTMAHRGSELPLASGDRDALQWARSSWSANNGNCVEVARMRDGRVAVRDSKNAPGPVLAFSRDAWQSFLAAVRAGSPRT